MKTSVMIEPRLESMVVCGGCCTEQYGTEFTHFHIYVNDVHVTSVSAVSA